MVTFLPSPSAPAARRPGATALFCLPGAGASARLFAGWDEDLPATVEAFAFERPGHGLRTDEEPHTDLDALLADLMDAVRPHAGRPLALLGHSFGAVLAFELALRLEREGAPVRHVFPVAARAAAGRTGSAPGQQPTDEELRSRLRSLGGTPAPVLDDEELFELLLPALRADFALTDTYRHRAGDVLDCAVTAFAGADDTVVPWAAVRAWGACTRGRFTVHRVPGGHFFPFAHRSARADLLRTIAEELDRRPGTVPGWPDTPEPS
ncbi:thioesterase II family protein [Streptomyces angustmyceticus]|uniref:thioesterase II family protein n=1 Tax=Streptomyces angustmyceticus TaxID=285578 RepID=UPI00380712D4